MTQPNSPEHSANVIVDQTRHVLRKELLTRRRQTPAEVRQQWDQLLMSGVLAWCRQHQPRSVGVYWPIHAEPDLRACYSPMTQMGIQLALPWVVEKNMPLRFLAWQEGDVMARDDYGIPLPAQREHLIVPYVLLIPCVGFSEGGYRLGYGGGYYDRTLALHLRCHAVGIAYQFALTEFNRGLHDRRLHEILTEQAHFKFV